MDIIVSGRHVSVTDAIKDYAKKKLEVVLSAYHKITSVKVVLDVQKSRTFVEIIVHGKNLDVEADDESYDMYKTIDRVVEKIDHQLARYFDKVQDHHKKARLQEKQKG